MTRQQQYSRDTSIEQMAADFLDTCFWSKLSSDKAVPVRWHDKEHQFAGIDISLSCASGRMCNFDEKCKTYGTLNTSMGVLSFECSFVNRGGHVQDGWLLKDSKTDYYAFVQLSATVDDVKLLESEEQLLAADMLWVKKADIKQLVEEQTGLAKLSSDAAELREDDNSLDAVMFGGKPRKRYQHGMFWLTFSRQLREKPVNLVVPVDTLASLPHSRRFLATRHSCKKI